MKNQLTYLILLLCITHYSAAQDPGPNQNYIGINIESLNDWEGVIMFADGMKTSRDWYVNSNGWNDKLPPGDLDENGWPKVDASIVVWAGSARDNSGTYLLSFESNSEATIAIREADGTVENVQYNASTHTTTANIVLTNPAKNILGLQFTNTGGGVRNVKLMRLVEAGGSVSQPLTDEFSEPFLKAIEPFHVLRFMHYMAAYHNPTVKWSDRPRPDYATYNRHPDGTTWTGLGGPLEPIINLCNQTGKDAWISFPILVDDDYIRHAAELFRDGNEFTHNKGLDPNCKLYVEWGNEVWNGNGPFDANLNHEIVIDEHANGDPYNYDFDGNTNDWYWAMRRIARKSLDVSRIFREVFGDNRMMSQVRPVFEWHLGYIDRGSDPLHYLEQAYIPMVDPGHPISYFFYGGGGSAYYGPDRQATDITLDNVWDSHRMDEDFWGSSVIANDARICATFGIKRIAYEGGPSLDKLNTYVDAINELAWSDSRMKDEVKNHHETWSEWGGDLLVYYSLRPGDYQWGFCNTIDDLSHPKFEAAKEISTATRTPISHHKSIPSITPGGEFDLAQPSWTSEPVISENQWRSYVYNVEVHSSCRVIVDYENGKNCRAVLGSDGITLSEKIISGTGSDTVPVYWPQGMHSIRVHAYGGSIKVTNITIEVLATGIKQNEKLLVDTKLEPNYPNPFKKSTTINYEIPAANKVSLKIYNSQGQEVKTLFDEEKPAGKYTVEWDGTNTAGQNSGKGIYFYQLKIGNKYTEAKKMIKLE